MQKERKSVKILLKQPLCITGRTVLTRNGQCFILLNVFSITKMTHIGFRLIEIVLNFSELQRFCSGPDSRAIVQPQALVRGVPVISSVMNQVISLVLLPLE